jgi:hypothetical protein
MGLREWGGLALRRPHSQFLSERASGYCLSVDYWSYFSCVSQPEAATLHRWPRLFAAVGSQAASARWSAVA